ERRVERARHREQRRRSRAELCDVHGPLPEGAVERPVQVAADENVDPRAENDERDEDRERRGEDRADAERPRHHPSSEKPTPRTVRISGGSPSFRRRYETYRSTTFRVAAAASPQTSSRA